MIPHLKLLTLKERQELLLQLMIEIDKFCRCHDIKYSLAGGTLLGSVRHKGFIPWDDDIDIYMLRDDFDRFTKIYKPTKYNALVFNTELNKNFLPQGFAKIVNPMTYVFDKHGWAEFGVFVDVFPLDFVPDNSKSQKKYIRKIRRLHNRFYHRHKHDIISILKSYHHSLDYWWNKIIKNLALYNNSNYKFVAHLIGAKNKNENTIIPKDYLESLIELPFEGHLFYSMQSPETYLTNLYGPDYMTPKIYPLHQTEVYLIEEEK